MANLGEGLRRLALEMSRHHVRLHPIRPTRRRPVTILVVVVVGLAAVVVGRPLVLVGTTMLCHLVSESRPANTNKTVGEVAMPCDRPSRGWNVHIGIW